MERLDDLVARGLEERLADPARREEILSIVLDRRQERAERRAAHATERRKKAAGANSRRQRLHDAIESGVADIGDESLRERIAGLRPLKLQAQVDAGRAAIGLDAAGAEISSAHSPMPHGDGYADQTAAIAAITFAGWPSRLRWRMATSGSWDRGALCSADWPPQAA